MNALEATLAAYSARDGVAYTMCNFRHRRLVDEPIALIPFQLGGEPFAVAALGYGTASDAYELMVPGQPLDRVQLFESLLPAARWFNAHFEIPWGQRRPVTRGVRNPTEEMLAPEAPQIVVTNSGVVKLLASVGRRLAYLPTDAEPGGPPPAPPELVRFGLHLIFATRRSREPGQQILLDMASLAAETWATAQTPAERANLGALFAWVDRPAGLDGFQAAAIAERTAAGPTPNPSDEDGIMEMVERLDDARRAGDVVAEAEVRAEIEDAYRRLVAPAWQLLWRVRAEQLTISEEPRYVPRRADLDAYVYSKHMEWMDGPAGGRRRTRDTVAQAIAARRKAEREADIVHTEETCSDPLKMIPLLLDHKAIEGEVVATDFEHAEVKPGNVRLSAVPLIRLRTALASLMPIGKELWWTEEPGRVSAVVREVVPDQTGPGSFVELAVIEGATAASPLRAAVSACFSELNTKTFPGPPLPRTDPFTHIAAEPETGPRHIEPEGDAAQVGAR